MPKITKKIIIANWKMNPKTTKEAEKIFGTVAKHLPTLKNTEVVICAPYIYFTNLLKIKTAKIALGAQDSSQVEDSGAYTGEVSPAMLYGAGIRYVILGHSERRALGEQDTGINKKIKSALSAGLMPILCVGETKRNEDHEYFNIVKNQLEACLDGVQRNFISKIIVAYEPVWALSTTENRHDATPEDSKEMAIFIRKVLADKFGVKIDMPRIIYGGSVNEKNTEEFMAFGGVDGLLPGKASLDPKKFIEIVKICTALKN